MPLHIVSHGPWAWAAMCCHIAAHAHILSKGHHIPTTPGRLLCPSNKGLLQLAAHAAYNSLAFLHGTVSSDINTLANTIRFFSHLPVLLAAILSMQMSSQVYDRWKRRLWP